MIFTQVSELTVLNEVQNHINNKIDGGIVCMPEQTVVWKGNQTEPNYTYINEHNIQCINILNEGNTIVTTPGDIDIAIFSHDNSANIIAQSFIDKVVQYLQSLNINAVNENNDILINGYKCLGWGSHRYGEILYAGIHVSVNVKIDVIKNVCMKPMTKIPKGMSDYGVTTDNILKILTDLN